LAHSNFEVGRSIRCQHAGGAWITVALEETELDSVTAIVTRVDPTALLEGNLVE